MVCVQAYEFIIRWNHHCSFPFIVFNTYSLSILHSFKKSFPILLPVFHRIKVHSCNMYAIGVRGIEPPTYASQKHRATSALHPVAVVPVAANPELPRRLPQLISQLIKYTTICGAWQMVPSAPIHTYESDAFL